MLRRKLARPLVVASFFALLFVVLLTGPVLGSGGDQPAIPERADLKYPNLSFMLNQLVARVEAGEDMPEWFPEESAVHKGSSLAVTIYLSGHAGSVAEFLEENGGDPRNVGEDYIEAYVPVTLLGQASQRPGVIRAGVLIPPKPLQDSSLVAGQGPEAHGSVAWNDVGLTGEGIKVGIIDTGFVDFGSLMGTELPATVEARCYVDVGVSTEDPLDCESDDNHGTIVSESVMDIAPEVSLYIANPLSKGDLQEVVDWMVSEGVSVINHSVGWTFDGPGDGASPYSNSPLNAVDRAVDGGILWVNAAGNTAQDTWFGGYSDSDGDGLIEWDGSDEFNTIRPGGGACNVTAQLRWEDEWGGATRDFDLLVLDSSGEVVGASEDSQSGGPEDVPFEELFGEIGDGYSVAVVHRSGSVPEWLQLTVWSDVTGNALEHYTLYGSITNPAESDNPGMLAVGAAPWYDLHTIEDYSSRGPTPDGREKPDIVGATCGETALMPLDEDDRGFCGTSQAAPHISGMAALVLQRFPTFTPEEIADYMKGNSEQREAPDPNNTWGFGFFVLPPPDIGPPDACTEALTGDGPVNGEWAPGCESQYRYGSYARYYALTLEEESEVIITLESEAGDSYLYLREGYVEFGEAVNDHVADDDALGWPDAQVRERLVPGTYTIEATTYKPYQSGSFALSLSRLGEETPPPPTPTPAAPPVATCEDTVGVDVQVNGEWISECESEERQGSYARYYSFTLASASEVTITLERASGEADTYLYLWEGDDTRSGEPLDENDDSPGTARSQIVARLGAGTYTIEATTFGPGETGLFTLSVSGL